MLVDDTNPDHYVEWKSNNVAFLEVDENGKYTIIANPKYDDLNRAYYYSDYTTKKYQGVKGGQNESSSTIGRYF